MKWNEMKFRALRNFSPTPRLVRNIGPPRSKCCDGKSITLWERGDANTLQRGSMYLTQCLAAVLAKQTVYILQRSTVRATQFLLVSGKTVEYS